MKNSSLCAGFAGAVVAVTLATGSAHATAIFNNLPPLAASGGDAGIKSTGGGGPLGNSFSTGSQAATLTDVMLLLRASAPSDGLSVAVGLYSNAMNAPGTLIASLGTILDSSLGTTLAVVTATPGSIVLLAPNTRYWVELSTSTGSARWSYSAVNTGVGVANEYNFYQGSSSTNASFTPYLAEVDVTLAAPTATPEPASLGLLAVAAAAGVARRRRRRPTA